VIGPGQKLRLLREQLGLTLRDVEQSSIRIGQRLRNDEYALPLSRISDIETKGVVPSVFRMYSLASIYRLDYLELLQWYGIDLSRLSPEGSDKEPKHTHRIQPLAPATTVDLPLKLDPSLDLRRTSNFGRLVEQWGLVPLSKLRDLADLGYTYGYIGAEDYTMYPLLLPGTFIQVDESKDQVVNEGNWRSEYERPIYFVETREGYICCWCSVKGDCIILQPHPLSPVPVRMMRFGQEAEIVGQVVGMAMRLDLFAEPLPPLEKKEPPKLT